jgi:aspartyl-tRNA(Asn)/glutamyl-tRNA(Gln) amidotransferase subunit C
LSRRSAKSASVDHSQVEKLASLSRLALDAEEAERLRGELSSILEYFSTLDRVDVSKVKDVGGRLEPSMREDVPRPSAPEDVLKGVPQKRGRYVKAPRVF